PVPQWFFRGRIRMDRLSRCHAIGDQLPAQGWRCLHPDNSEFHTGAAPQLSNRRATCRLLPRIAEFRFAVLRRLERRQRHRFAYQRTELDGTSVQSDARAAAAGWHRLEMDRTIN